MLSDSQQAQQRQAWCFLREPPPELVRKHSAEGWVNCQLRGLCKGWSLYHGEHCFDFLPWAKFDCFHAFNRIVCEVHSEKFHCTPQQSRKDITKMLAVLDRRYNFMFLDCSDALSSTASADTMRDFLAALKEAYEHAVLCPGCVVYLHRAANYKFHSYEAQTAAAVRAGYKVIHVVIGQSGG